MPHASEMKPPRIGIRVEKGEGSSKLGSITVPLAAVDGLDAGDQVQLMVIGTVEKIGRDTAVLRLADIQPTEPLNPANSMEKSLRSSGRMRIDEEA